MKRRHLPPKPQAPENGMFIVNGQTGEEHFITFDELSQACSDMMNPIYAYDVATEFGKIDYRQDPTYNMKRKRNAQGR